MTWLYYFAVVGFGLIFGSFFNVAIYRLPRERTLGNRSICPNCGGEIRWYDNVPVLSFALLRGRCRDCGQPISWRYPLVEAGTALLFALMYWWSTAIVPGLLKIPGGKAFQPELLIGLVLVSVLVVITGVDITHGLIPNKVVAAGLVMMVPLVIALSLYREQPGRMGLAAATAATGSAFFLLAGFLYGLVFMPPGHEAGEDGEPEKSGEPVPEGDTGRDPAAGVDPASGPDEEEDEGELRTGIGMGDMKLMLVTGLALGYFHWYFVIVHIFLATLIGSLAAIPLLFIAGKGRKARIPFGPFLAAGAILTLIWGQAIVDLYLKLLR